MQLPKNFQFSQKSLADYIACKRLFRFLHIDQINWPAIEIEPVHNHERRMKLGENFHRGLQQFFAGVPREKIENHIKDEVLKTWWTNFTDSLDQYFVKDDFQLPEVRLSAPINDQRIIAKLDLIVVKPDGRRIIFDWKTTTKRPDKSLLRDYMQTRVYPYLLSCSGDHVYPWKEFSPQQVEMVYWFAEYPGTPVRIEYSEKQFIEDEKYLSDLIEEICTLSESNFVKTDDERRCAYCVYRSLCDRGIEAGKLEDLEELILEDTDVIREFDFDQITEVEY